VKILVTGGCGFIGQHVVEILCQKYGEDNVWVYDIGSPVATGWNRVHNMVGWNLIRGDVCNQPSMKRAILKSEPDVVMHLAAQSHVDKSIANPSKTMRTNAMGTQVVASWCAYLGVPMLYCSTDEVYGDAMVPSPNGPFHVVRPCNERNVINPSSPYSASKAAGEHAVRSCGRTSGLRYAITRGCNAWGLNQYPEKLIPIVCRTINREEKVPIHGSGNQIRQWIHVEEFASQMIRVAEALHDGDVDGDTFNIAGPVSTTVKHLAMEFARCANGLTEVSESDVLSFGTERPGQDMAYSVDGSKMRRVLSVSKAERNVLDWNEIAMLLIHYGSEGVVNIADFASITRNQKEYKHAT